MSKLDDAQAQIKSTYHYLDVVRFWFQRPLSPAELRYLNAHSAKVKLGKDQRIKEPLYWAPQWKQVIALYQPQREAIEFLVDVEKVLITYVEIARDQIMTSRQAVDQWSEFTYAHFVQKWHGKQRFRMWDNGNWRSGDLSRVVWRHGKKERQRKIGTVYQAYRDRRCKVTDEDNCFHLEAKVYSSAAIKRLGIHHPKDLLSFNAEAFWEKHFRLFKVDRERLGRWYENKLNQTRLRFSPAINDTGYNRHRAVGSVLSRIYGLDEFGNPSTQLLVDQIRRGPFLVQLSL
jgi:hypothetical protein